MSRSKRLTDADRMEIVREAAEGVSTSVLAERFGVSVRAIQYTLKADAERQTDAAIPVSAVSVKVTAAELAALDEVLAEAGIESRAEGLRRLIQAAGGVFVPDAQMAAEMARYRASLHEVGNGVAQIAKQMTQANRRGRGPWGHECRVHRIAPRADARAGAVHSGFRGRDRSASAPPSRRDAAAGHGRAEGVCPCG
nr:helix-turn-helix domain-containing protein [Leisingera sp. NJS201]